MSSTLYTSFTPEKPPLLDAVQKVTLALGSLGLLLMLISWAGVSLPSKALMFYTSMGLIFFGVIVYSWRTYMIQPAGIKNNGNFFSSISHRGVLAWISAILITGFYVVLYLKAEYLGLGDTENSGLVAFFRSLIAVDA